MGQGRDLFGTRKDGTNFPVEVGLNPFKLEDDHYVMAMVIDITLRKNQEREILMLNTLPRRAIFGYATTALSAPLPQYAAS